MLIKNGNVHDAVNRAGHIADVLVADGKIKAIGENLSAPDGDEIIDGAVVAGA